MTAIEASPKCQRCQGWGVVSPYSIPGAGRVLAPVALIHKTNDYGWMQNAASQLPHSVTFCPRCGGTGK